MLNYHTSGLKMPKLPYGISYEKRLGDRAQFLVRANGYTEMLNLTRVFVESLGLTLSDAMDNHITTQAQVMSHNSVMGVALFYEDSVRLRIDESVFEE